jgi:hypothetical protein
MQKTQILIADPSTVKLDEMQYWITHNCSSDVEIKWTKEQTTPFDLVVQYLFHDLREALAFQLEFK